MAKRCRAHQKLNCYTCTTRASSASNDDTLSSLFVDTSDFSGGAGYDYGSSSCDSSSSSSSDSGSSSCD